MERDLTSGSVFRNVIIFFAALFFILFFADAYMGWRIFLLLGSLMGLPVQQRYSDWESGDAYVHGDDRGAGDGDYGYNRAVYWSRRQEKGFRVLWEIR